MLDIYEMIVAAFLVTNKTNWVRFLEEIFLIANMLISWAKNSNRGLTLPKKPSQLPDLLS